MSDGHRSRSTGIVPIPWWSPTLPPTPIRVVLVEDRPEIRALVASILSEGSGLDLQSTTTEAVPDLLGRIEADVVVLGSGLSPEPDALRTLRRAHPDLPVVLFSPQFAPGSRASRVALALGGCTRLPCPRARYAPDRLRDLVRGTLRPWIEKVVRARRSANQGQSMYMEVMDPRDAQFVRDLIRRRTGVIVDSGRDFLLQARLAPLARRKGLVDMAALVLALRANDDARIESEVIEAVLNDREAFFRDTAQFEVLRTTLLPDLIERRSGERSLGLWSASCSTGQEAYSLAMELAERLPELDDWSVRILATDVSPNAVRRAGSGRYDQLEVSRGVPIQMLGRHFERSGDGWKVRPAIRERIEFRVLNLIEPWPELPLFDLVLMGDVLLYFEDAVRRSILQRLAAQIRVGGALLTGSAMRVRDETGWESLEGANGYRRVA